MDQARVVAWPGSPVSLEWPVANQRGALIAFRNLLSAGSQHRLLLIDAPSARGKTLLAREMYRTGRTIGNVRCGRLDFKGTTGMEIELEALATSLRVARQSGTDIIVQLSAIMGRLRESAEPTLLIFDTFESAGPAAGWIDRVLLEEAFHADWLRVVILGQRVPEIAGATWESVCAPRLTLALPDPDDWYGLWHRLGATNEITLSLLTDLHTAVKGSPAILASVVQQSGSVPQ
jgi:hypothetical protein